MVLKVLTFMKMLPVNETRREVQQTSFEREDDFYIVCFCALRSNEEALVRLQMRGGQHLLKSQLHEMKLCYSRRTARRASVLVEILSSVALL